ncbi:MAG: sodium:solute symporter family protein [Desulfuromonadales bacterium]|nr:sodium:solute symporter family protein [Desulfuromonadales bacterium]
MNLSTWTWLLVGLTFSAYLAIAIWSRAVSTGAFYVAEKSIHPVMNGMATAADWMSAGSFISMASLISFMGRDGSMYLMGWTGGYVLLALCLAPYLRKYGKYTVPHFIGDRYDSKAARLIALICTVFISFTYVAGQMRGVGLVFSRFLNVPINTGVLIGMLIVFFTAALGGMKGTTYTQVVQYCVLIAAYMIPAIFISVLLTGNPIPQLGYGSSINAAGAEQLHNPALQGRYLLDVLDGLHHDLGFAAYTSGLRPRLDLFCIVLALMVGTAGLPHVIVRFFTVRRVSDARSSAGWALVFIAILYTTAPAVAAFARTNFLLTIHGQSYAEAPQWFHNWEATGLVRFTDHNGDGIMQYADNVEQSEIAIDRDILVLANPEIAGLPNWVIALVTAGGLAAALSTAAGLLLVISAAVAHDLVKGIVKPDLSETSELLLARASTAVAVVIAGLFGIYPPGFVAQVVAFAFGLAAASLFPVLLCGVFSRRVNTAGAMTGMLAGLLFTSGYIIYFKYIDPAANGPEHWWFGISPEGIGTVGMLLNFACLLLVSKLTPPPAPRIRALVDDLRSPGEQTRLTLTAERRAMENRR